MAGSSPLNKLYESMTKAVLNQHGWSMRVWRNESKFTSGPDPEVISTVINNFNRPPMIVAEEVAKLPRVEAVEVLDQDGNGSLIYPDWR